MTGIASVELRLKRSPTSTMLTSIVIHSLFLRERERETERDREISTWTIDIVKATTVSTTKLSNFRTQVHAYSGPLAARSRQVVT